MQLTSLIGTKSFQKQGFLQSGKRVPLTGVIVSGNVITQIKTKEKEGYSAIQLGFGISNKAGKTKMGHSKKAGLTKAARFFKEIKVEDIEGATLGLQLNASEIFAPGDLVDVTGTSKGKGWAGGVKRYGFHGGPRTHGQSDRERAPGSIGQTTTPGRVYKGKKMAGRMGTDQVTVKNLEIIEVTNDGVMLIKGLIPGLLNGLVLIKKAGQNKKFEPLYKEKVEEPAPENKSEVQSEEVKAEKSEEAVLEQTEESVSQTLETQSSEDKKVEEIKEEKVEEDQNDKQEEVVEDAK